MGSTPLRISLSEPQVHQITMNSTVARMIGLTTPVAQSSVRLTIDTTENWSARTTYIPKKGEIVVYSDRRILQGVPYPGIKIGDGSAYVVDLPFVGDDSDEMTLDLLYDHLNDMEMHIYNQERSNWNNKISCSIDGETLILERDDEIG